MRSYLGCVSEVVVRSYFFAAFYEANGASARNPESIQFCRTLTPPVVLFIITSDRFKSFQRGTFAG